MPARLACDDVRLALYYARFFELCCLAYLPFSFLCYCFGLEISQANPFWLSRPTPEFAGCHGPAGPFLAQDGSSGVHNGRRSRDGGRNEQISGASIATVDRIVPVEGGACRSSPFSFDRLLNLAEFETDMIDLHHA